jgi:hypothetical protein
MIEQAEVPRGTPLEPAGSRHGYGAHPSPHRRYIAPAPAPALSHHLFEAHFALEDLVTSLDCSFWKVAFGPVAGIFQHPP